MERREVQKRDANFRSQQPSSIDTSTPRLQPDQRRQPSFSSPTYSPAVSPTYSDNTSRGFYSPRGGEEDEEDVDEDDDEEELHEVDERGEFYRPRSPPVRESPVTTTVSRSVRVEPKVVTRVDTGAKEREFIQRRVVEDGGLDFGAGRPSARRRWEGRNTIVFESGTKQKEVYPGSRIVGEEENVDFRDGRSLNSVGRRTMVADSDPKQEFVPERIVSEDEGVEFKDGRGPKLVDRNSTMLNPSLKEKEVVQERIVVDEEGVELRDGRGKKLLARKAILLDSGLKEKEVVQERVVVGEERVELRDGRGEKLLARNAIVLDSSPKEKEVVTGQRVDDQRSVEFIDGRGFKFEGRHTMVFNSGPTVVYDSRPKKEVVGTGAAVLESSQKEEKFVVDGAVEEGGDGGSEGGEGERPLRRRRHAGRKIEVLALRKVSLWLRILGFVMCLISFSVMAANKNKGWALDSFDRYKEFRYCMAVSILGFVYSAAQACNVAYHLGTDQYTNQHSQFRYYLDFFMDQALSYLLISASSSAATRVEDWVSNWGRDKFPQMASASVIVSFLAFGAFAFSSVISGYTLCSANA